VRDEIVTGKKRYGILDRLDSLIYRRLMPVKAYPNWEAASKAAGQNNYAGSILNEFRVARRRGVDQATLSPALASLVRDRFRIVDFGGSTGDLGDLLIEANPSISYTVVENPTMVHLMQQQQTRVLFSITIPIECDVFFTSGTIQYISEPYQALREGFSSAAKYAVLVRNNFADVDRFTIHRSRLFDNGSGPLPTGFNNLVMRCPMRTIQEKRVHEIATECGLVLDQRRDDPDFTYKGGYSKDLIFRRP
jgi:putative methyltransferase (TIGR04325 family)